MYGYCVGIAGITPEYYLDEMSQDEVTAIMKSKSEVDKSQWEQTRLLSFYTIVAQQGNKQIKSPKDLFSFPWDEGKVETLKAKTLTREEFLEKAKMIK